MSSYRELKEDFLADLAVSPSNGVDIRVDPTRYGEIYLPERLKQKWIKRFYVNETFSYPKQPRLVNHFKLGADPEFVFMNKNGEVEYATHLGLKAGLAIGADNNGRLAELRPKPSKFALKVVASLYAELLFLVQTMPEINKYTLYASPFAGKDALGGHVHFGRWKKTRVAEVAALDMSMILLEQAGTFDWARQKERLRNQNGIYGKYGDFRVQGHGYEYRTYPSYLGEAKYAHLYITLAKLAVHNPKLFTNVNAKHINHNTAMDIIFNILSYYKDLDDDARIARAYVKSCYKPPYNDILAGWGIKVNPEGFYKDDITSITPTTIKPSDSLVEKMFNFLVSNKVIAPEKIEGLQEFPKGYQPFQKVMDTNRHPGLGEIVWDLALGDIGVKLLSVTVRPSSTAVDYIISVTNPLCCAIKAKWGSKRIEAPNGIRIQVTEGANTILGQGVQIQFPSNLITKCNPKWVKEFLTSGLFPFVRIGQTFDPKLWKVKQKEIELYRG